MQLFYLYIKYLIGIQLAAIERKSFLPKQTKLPPLVAAHGVGTLGTILKDVLLGVFTRCDRRQSLSRICRRNNNNNSWQPDRTGGG